VDKIKAAVDARLDRNLVIIGRCDGMSLGMTMEQSFERGVAYAEAGADVIFFAGLRLQDCPKAADAVKRPLMHTINNTPLEEVKKSRVNLAVYAGQVLSVALGAARQALRDIKSTGVIPNYQQKVIPGGEQAQLLRTPDVVARARKYNVAK
jgi:methylisocitrate lyase